MNTNYEYLINVENSWDKYFNKNNNITNIVYSKFVKVSDLIYA